MYSIQHVSSVAMTSLTHIMQEPANAQQAFSSETDPCVWKTFPLLEFLQSSWENMAKTPKFAALKPALTKGLASLNKYYKLSDNADANIVCLSTCIVLFTFLIPRADVLLLQSFDQISRWRTLKTSGTRIG